jgi:A/G-specific adenine glycosylase
VNTSRFQTTIKKYYTVNKRDFPWRKTRDPYRVLVSEIMLQQTQTDRVIPKYENWLKHFPTFESLAQATLQHVLKEWKGLGYNSRALRLQKTAQEVVAKYNGKLPRDYEKILALPGIGPYTAGAIMAFAFNKPFPIIETNIRTVFIHFYFNDHGQVHDKEILELVTKTLDTDNPKDWYYALMDYGVMLKKTIGNLNIKSKHYTKQSQFKGSHRELRAKILHFITEKPATRTTIEKYIQTELKHDAEKVIKTLEKLEQEGFIQKTKQVYYIYESTTNSTKASR